MKILMSTYNGHDILNVAELFAHSNCSLESLCNTVYRVVLPFSTCKQFHPVLNSPTDNESNMGKNKTGANISLYMYIVLFTHKCQWNTGDDLLIVPQT
jgi:hypothetical protein